MSLVLFLTQDTLMLLPSLDQHKGDFWLLRESTASLIHNSVNVISKHDYILTD